MSIFKRRTERSTRPPVGREETSSASELIERCFCADGHNLLSSQATFSGHPGITLKLRNERQEGLLSLSPIIGDKNRTFFDSEWIKGEIVAICCPTCSQPLPVYNQCFCGADLVAIFTRAKGDFANCVGICQRIGCTHAEIISNRDLTVSTRFGLFENY